MDASVPAAGEGAGDAAPEGPPPGDGAGDGAEEAPAEGTVKHVEPTVRDVKTIKPCTQGRRPPPPSPPPSPGGTPPPPSTPAGSFCWDALMRRPTFEAAPVECFRHAPLSQTWRNVCAGLKAEVVQRRVGKGAATTYWVATLLQVQGYRGLFRPEGLGSDPSQDRWLELCSTEVKPVGWCAARGLPLTPPVAAGPAADWQRRLVGVLTGSRTLPPAFYRKVMASLSRGSQLSVGQTLEVVDKSCISQVRAARVSRQVGRRLHVHYLDAHEDDQGFWCHENSPLVHPVGWARAVGHRIEAPDDYLARCETGQFLATDATEDCLPAPPAVTHEGFRVGMKLEALDPLNLGSIGVATVRQTLGNHFMMVRLETSPDSDWFCYHASSPYIFPAGFCRTVGITLTPPHGHSGGGSSFLWEDYLRAHGATAAPAHLFHRPPLSHGFQPGHKLEAVDLMDPQLVCAATVSAVVGRLLRIHFDGWEERFDQWADAESPDLFPVGWCRLVGYPLEPPRPPERPAAKRVVKKRVPGRRGRPRLRGAGGRGKRMSAGRSVAGGESESESVTGDGESVAGSGTGSRLSPPATPGSGATEPPRFDLSPTPTPEPRAERSLGPTPEPRSLGPTPEPRSLGQTPEPPAGSLPASESPAGTLQVTHEAPDMPPESPSRASAEMPSTVPATGGSTDAPAGVTPEMSADMSTEEPPDVPAEAEGHPMEVCEGNAPETETCPAAQGDPPDTAPPSGVPMET